MDNVLREGANKMKVCSGCYKNKNLKDFVKDKRRQDRYSGVCKICFNSVSRSWSHKNPEKVQARYKRLKSKTPWIRTFHIIGQRCNNSNHDKYEFYGGIGITRDITSEELKKLYIRDEASLMKNPTINRIDGTQNYTFDNCEYTEFDINRRLAHVLR